MLRTVCLCFSLMSISSYALADLIFSQASVRPMPPMQKNTVAFMKITNTGEEAITLIEASSNVSEKTEFHTHIMQNDMVKMQQMSQLIIPAQQSIFLQSGGQHLMLINLKPDWMKQGEVEFILHDKQQKSYSITVSIQATTPDATEHHHHH